MSEYMGHMNAARNKIGGSGIDAQDAVGSLQEAMEAEDFAQGDIERVNLAKSKLLDASQLIAQAGAIVDGVLEDESPDEDDEDMDEL